MAFRQQNSSKISTQTDVQIHSATESEVLTYNATFQKWENRQPAVVVTTTQNGTSYTLTLQDSGTVVETTGSSAVAITVPSNATVPFPVGMTIMVRQYGAGQLSIVAASGVTIRSRGGALNLAGQYSEAVLTKRAIDEWILSGDLTS